MWRSLQLAKKGCGATKNNPMVGCVIVHNDKIIGEGYHRKMGQPHAEVNAIAAVKNKLLLKESTLYVTLEPCSHYGKTPPCAALIVSKEIPRVVVAVKDPNKEVAGRGVAMLEQAGVAVTLGVLEEEAKQLNEWFFVNQLKNRPYITLKWAQTRDGFIDYERESGEKPPLKLSNNITQSVVHKLRSERMGIMVGTNTALKDNPNLNVRNWYGDNPVRIVLDRTGKLPPNSNLFNQDAPTVVFTAIAGYTASANTRVEVIDFEGDVVRQIIDKLYEMNIATLFVEGGNVLISSFVEKGMWDEAYVEVANKTIGTGVRAPQLKGEMINAKKYIDSLHYHIKMEICRNLI